MSNGHYLPHIEHVMLDEYERRREKWYQVQMAQALSCSLKEQCFEFFTGVEQQGGYTSLSHYLNFESLECESSAKNKERTAIGGLVETQDCPKEIKTQGIHAEEDSENGGGEVQELREKSHVVMPTEDFDEFYRTIEQCSDELDMNLLQKVAKCLQSALTCMVHTHGLCVGHSLSDGDHNAKLKKTDGVKGVVSDNLTKEAETQAPVLPSDLHRDKASSLTSFGSFYKFQGRQLLLLRALLSSIIEMNNDGKIAFASMKTWLGIIICNIGEESMRIPPNKFSKISLIFGLRLLHSEALMLKDLRPLTSASEDKAREALSTTSSSSLNFRAITCVIGAMQSLSWIIEEQQGSADGHTTKISLALLLVAWKMTHRMIMANPTMLNPCYSQGLSLLPISTRGYLAWKSVIIGTSLAAKCTMSNKASLLKATKLSTAAQARQMDYILPIIKSFLPTGACVVGCPAGKSATNLHCFKPKFFYDIMKEWLKSTINISALFERSGKTWNSEYFAHLCLILIKLLKEFSIAMGDSIFNSEKAENSEPTVSKNSSGTRERLRVEQQDIAQMEAEAQVLQCNVYYGRLREYAESTRLVAGGNSDDVPENVADCAGINHEEEDSDVLACAREVHLMETELLGIKLNKHIEKKYGEPTLSATETRADPDAEEIFSPNSSLSCLLDGKDNLVIEDFPRLYDKERINCSIPVSGSIILPGGLVVEVCPTNYSLHIEIAGKIIEIQKMLSNYDKGEKNSCFQGIEAHDRKVISLDGAKALFRRIISLSNAALNFYVINRWATEHVRLKLLQVYSHRHFSKFLQDKRNALSSIIKLLRPLCHELNPNYYRSLVRELNYECAWAHIKLADVLKDSSPEASDRLGCEESTTYKKRELVLVHRSLPFIETFLNTFPANPKELLSLPAEELLSYCTMRHLKTSMIIRTNTRSIEKLQRAYEDCVWMQCHIAIHPEVDSDNRLRSLNHGASMLQETLSARIAAETAMRRRSSN